MSQCRRKGSVEARIALPIPSGKHCNLAKRRLSHRIHTSKHYIAFVENIILAVGLPRSTGNASPPQASARWPIRSVSGFHREKDP